MASREALRRFCARLVASLRPGRAEAELSREVDAHLRLLEDRFRAQGMGATDARFAARRAFGGVVQAQADQRSARSFRWLADSLIDFKLAVRILVKYPGLTCVGGVGLAVVIAIASVAFSGVSTLLNPELPLEEGDRVVALQYWDPVANNAERRVLHDFVTWRETLRSVVDLGAFRQTTRNLIAAGGSPEPVAIAEITASAFSLARVPPLIGRHLVDADEHPGASPTALVGYEVWQRRFGGDPLILGKTIQLGDIPYTVVGVMPETFAFPINHNIWVPLQLDPARYERLKSPGISVFARLAPGATREQAQAELATVAARTAAAFPATHRQLRPQVLPYTYPFSDMDDPQNAMALRLIEWLVVLLMVVVCANVAVLVYARTATREEEIAVRSALGASRPRIVVQLFVEVFVLSALAAVAGLGFAAVALKALPAALQPLAGRLPFWIHLRISLETVLYVLALTIFSAAIIGVIPALKATGRGVQARLQGLSRGSGLGMQLGGTWTALIVAQVMFAVALLPAAVSHGWTFVYSGTVAPGPAARTVLTAQLVMERGLPSERTAASQQAFTARYASRQAELIRRLDAEPSVARATFALQVPGEERMASIEIDGIAHQARFNRVDIGFFEAFGVPILRGRPLDTRDVGPHGTAVVVNRTFAEDILGNGEVIGRRLRYVGMSGDVDPEHLELGRWYEVVGVVADFPWTPAQLRAGPKLYHPAAHGEIYPATIAVHLRGTTPAGFAGRLRELTAAVDPTIQLHEVLTIDEVARREQGVMRLAAGTIVVLGLSVIALSAAGIYALMSFTIVRRRREIGIRTALGAQPHRVLRSILSRAFAQLAVGVVLGIAAAVFLETLSEGDLTNGNAAMVIPIVALLMTLVGLGATVGPARRGLRVDPSEALRDE